MSPRFTSPRFTSPRFTSPVQSSLVREIQYAELITRARLRGQDFATCKNFSFNQCHTKSFAFFLGKFIL